MQKTGLVPGEYLPRIVDEQIQRYLQVFGAVEVAGTRWCGKTWTSLRHAKSASYVDDDFEVASASPALMLQGEKPHVIDEWQLVPGIWDAVRRAVDTSGGRGGWILTGSSTPVRSASSGAAASLSNAAASKRTPHHSGAGRIGRIRMHPMTLSESGDSTREVSLSGLFRGEFEPAIAPSDPNELVELTCRGGWPAAIGQSAEDAQLLAREYLRLFFTESVPAQGKSGEVASRIVASLARNLGQAAKYRTIKLDMYGEEDDPDSLISDQTLASYLGLLKSNFLVEEVPGWVPPARSRKRVATKPKRYLADPSLALAQLGMSPDALLHDWQTFGLAFESLCVRDLTVYARALPQAGLEPVRYYRDETGLEADAIIELMDGRWAAFEIKVSEDKVDDAVRSLVRLRDKLMSGDQSRTRPPEFMAVVTGLSKYAREVEKDIYVLPIRCLTA